MSNKLRQRHDDEPVGMGMTTGRAAVVDKPVPDDEVERAAVSVRTGWRARKRVVAAGLCITGFGLAMLGLGSVSVPAVFAVAALVAGCCLAAVGAWLLKRSPFVSQGGSSRVQAATVPSRGDCKLERPEDMRRHLRDPAQRLREILDAQDYLIVRRDRAGRILFANLAFCRMFGLDVDRVPGMRFEPNPVAEGGGAGERFEVGAPGEACTQQVETAIGPRWITWRSQSIPHSGGTGYEQQTVGWDVTEQRALSKDLAAARDEAKAANRAKSRFLASMSHEIRTPMNGILGMAGLLVETGPSAEQKTYIEAIDQSARTLLSLIDEILDFSRIEAGRLQIKAEPFDLEACVQSVVELLAPRAHGKSLEIAWTVPPDLPRSLVGDEVRLRQILINLVGNAIKFTERGGVRVCVEMCGSEAAMHRLRIKVADTGVGLSPDEASTVFGEFSQGAEAASLGAGGSGLGLAISRQLARAMGGDITVVSTRGQGATFTLDVVLTADPDGRTVVRPTRFPRDFCVLLASEQLIERRAIADLLRASGARVFEVSDAGNAEDIAAAVEAAGRVDAMVVDAQADPLAAGDTLAQLTRRFGCTGITGIVLADASERANLRALRAAGFRRFLVRPVRPETLFRLLVGAHKRDGAMGGGSVAGMAERGADDYAGVRVLLAEDNDINALLSMTLLRKLGCVCQRAYDGAEAIEAVRDTVEGDAPRYDLILMDLSMPRVDGITAMRAIRDLFTNAPSRCPIIVAVTANAYSEDRKHALAQGMDGFVVKPFERGEIEALLARCMPVEAAGDPVLSSAP